MREFPGDKWWKLETEKEVLLFDKLEETKVLLQQYGLWSDEESLQESLAVIICEAIEGGAAIGESMEKIRIKRPELD